jgi:hypothetical protein
LAALAILAASTLPALAASPKPIGSFRDWTAYSWTENGKPICFMMTLPKSSQPTNVNRGDIYLMVTYRPYLNSTDEVSHVTGYPYRDDSTAKVTIDDDSFSLFTKDDVAWAPSEEDDARLIREMRAGAELVVEGVSQRGTTTIDTYSLFGFTAAYERIHQVCG